MSREAYAIAELDAWASNNVNISTSSLDKPGLRSACRLLAMQVLSGEPIHAIDADLLALGWAAGLRGRYWLLYVNDAGGDAYTQAQVGYWRATHAPKEPNHG